MNTLILAHTVLFLTIQVNKNIKNGKVVGLNWKKVKKQEGTLQTGDVRNPTPLHEEYCTKKHCNLVSTQTT